MSIENKLLPDPRCLQRVSTDRLARKQTTSLTEVQQNQAKARLNLRVDFGCYQFRRF